MPADTKQPTGLVTDPSHDTPRAPCYEVTASLDETPAACSPQGESFSFGHQIEPFTSRQQAPTKIRDSDGAVAAVIEDVHAVTCTRRRSKEKSAIGRSIDGSVVLVAVTTYAYLMLLVLIVDERCLLVRETG
jgi:hypothetical protein